MVSVLGFSFSAPARTPRSRSCRSRRDERRAPRTRRRRSPAAPRRLSAGATPSSSRSCRRRSGAGTATASRSASRTAAATATPRSRGAQPAARHGGAEQDPRRRAARRPRGRAAAAARLDRDRASALGVTFDNINAVLSTALGSAYVNDFPNAGRLQRVVVQADAPHRMEPDDLLRLNASTTTASRCRCRRWRRRAGSPARSRRCASTATRRCASPATRRRAIARRRDARDGAARRPAARRARLRMDRPVARGAPVGLDRDVLLGFSLLAVFLCLSALYESWSIPFAVLLVVPLGVLGAVLGASCAACPTTSTSRSA